MDNAELVEKEGRLRGMMREHGLDAVLLGRSANFAWLSGGRSYINIATDGGVASLLITRDSSYLLTDVIEVDRLREEEGFAGSQWEVVAEAWHEPRRRLGELTAGLRVGSDTPG